MEAQDAFNELRKDMDQNCQSIKQKDQLIK